MGSPWAGERHYSESASLGRAPSSRGTVTFVALIRSTSSMTTSCSSNGPPVRGSMPDCPATVTSYPPTPSLTSDDPSAQRERPRRATPWPAVDTSLRSIASRGPSPPPPAKQEDQVPTGNDADHPEAVDNRHATHAIARVTVTTSTTSVSALIAVTEALITAPTVAATVGRESSTVPTTYGVGMAVVGT
jgi:hypothetical protein